MHAGFFKKIRRVELPRGGTIGDLVSKAVHEGVHVKDIEKMCPKQRMRTLIGLLLGNKKVIAQLEKKAIQAQADLSERIAKRSAKQTVAKEKAGMKGALADEFLGSPLQRGQSVAEYVRHNY